MNSITIIIPTLGRLSLSRALASLIKQSDPRWQCIVVFDGIEKRVEVEGYGGRKIECFTCTQKKHAGLVRNEALNRVTTEWIGFLDDDDTLDHTYIERFNHWRTCSDLIIFPFRQGRHLIPGKGLKNFGISFCVRKEFISQHQIVFSSGKGEDSKFVCDCIKKGAKKIMPDEFLYHASERSNWHQTKLIEDDVLHIKGMPLMI
jgi:glycosyltransferase involved in cell wall biosynthesis